MHQARSMRVLTRLLLTLLVLAGLLSAALVSRQKASAATYTVTVYPAAQDQMLQGWGTSLAWWAAQAGGYSNSLRTQIADALFSPTTGIGLNVLRYNFGAQTPANTCTSTMSPSRLIPSYEQSSGTYDWTQDANQRWIIQAAQARGANLFEGFVNSPPAWMLINKCTAGTTANTNNLSSSNYAAFADYMVQIARHFHDTWGIPLTTLEPFNEPGSSWWTSSGSQEGMYTSNSAQNAIIKLLGAELASAGMTTYSNVSSPDSYAETEATTSYNSYDSTAKSYLAQLNTHGYAGTSWSPLGQRDNKRVWMSEWGTGSQSSNIAAGLALSNHILADEQQLHPSAWILWQAMNEPNSVATPTDVWGLIAGSDTLGISFPSRYYAMGNYSKFIRPGYRMLENSDAASFTAYDAGSHQLVIVTTNSTTSANTVTFNLGNFTSVGSSATPYRTSASENLAQLSALSISNKQFTSSIPASSITTFVIPNVTYTGAGASTEIDDATSGSGTNQFNYSGSGWSHCTGGCSGDSSGLYNGSNSWASSSGNSLTISFSGPRIRLFGVKAPNHGIGLVSIDGGASSEVDFYAATRAGDQLMWESPQLTSGTHTLTLTVTGNKNPNSTGTSVVPDRVQVDTTISSLLANSSFETGSLSPWASDLNASQAGIETNFPFKGTYDAYLHPTSSLSTRLYQTITATSTKTYTLSAYAAANISGVQLGVDVGGTQVSSLNVTANVSYRYYTTTFTVTAGQTIRVWYSAGAVSGWATLDNVLLY